jgi:hypothetical protein
LQTEAALRLVGTAAYLICSSHKVQNLSLSETYYLQGAAAARLVGKADIFTASKYGLTSLIGDHFVVNAACIHQQDIS